MAIVRPSIVGCAYRDPMPGWVDNLAAMSGFIFVFGIGLIHDLPGKWTNAANVIPVDHCVNAMITVCAKQAYKNSLLVCHAASPGFNPITHKAVTKGIINYSQENPFDRKAFKIKLSITPKAIFKVKRSFSKMKVKTIHAMSRIAWVKESIKNKVNELVKGKDLG